MGQQDIVPRTLFERVQIAERLRPFVTDCRLNLFEIAWLSGEQLAKFRSDFRIVAEFFVQSRRDRNFVPAPQVIKHVDAMLKMMEILTGDRRFEAVQNEWKINPPKEVTMSAILDRIEKMGMKKGRAEGRVEERTERAQKALLLGLPPEQIAHLFDMTLEEVLALKPADGQS